MESWDEKCTKQSLSDNTSWMELAGDLVPLSITSDELCALLSVFSSASAESWSESTVSLCEPHKLHMPGPESSSWYQRGQGAEPTWCAKLLDNTQAFTSFLTCGPGPWDSCHQCTILVCWKWGCAHLNTEVRPMEGESHDGLELLHKDRGGAAFHQEGGH